MATECTFSCYSMHRITWLPVQALKLIYSENKHIWLALPAFAAAARRYARLEDAMLIDWVWHSITFNDLLGHTYVMHECTYSQLPCTLQYVWEAQHRSSSIAMHCDTSALGLPVYSVSMSTTCHRHPRPDLTVLNLLNMCDFACYQRY